MNALILSARLVDFEDESGRRVEGVKVTYCLPGDVMTEGNTRGCPPMTIFADKDLSRHISSLPGLYSIDFRQLPGPNGKPTLKIVRASLLQEIKLTDDAAA
jgi:hypothetical protein